MPAMPVGRPRESPAAAAQRIETRVRERITPSPEELARVARVRADLVRAVQLAAEARKSPLARALVAGSAARGTFLRDRLDIDFFLLFPPELPRARLETEGLALAEAILTKPERKYAEHPYLRGTFQGYTVDVVPGYAITDPSKPLTAVDRTPFHDEHLRAHQTPANVAEVRLAKLFLRSLGIYGSEARTEGFSGYLVELVILQFGTLHALLEAARSWRLPVRLCPPGKEPPRLPPDVALILPDAVDPNRNVASALSPRNLALFILGAAAYLEHPGEEWFELPKRRHLSRADALERVARRATHVSVVEVPRPALVDDTLYPQLRKAERAIAEEATRVGFEVVGSACAAGPAALLVLVEVAHGRLSAVRVQDGPPAGLDRVGSFLEKWTAPGAPVSQGPYVREDGRLGIEVRRSECDLEIVLAAAIPRLSLGKDISPAAAERTQVRRLADQPESPELEGALVDLLGKRLPWLGPR